MDLTFLLVTLILIIFLFISYLLRVIKLCTPLLLIYLIFCFTYIIDNETSKDTIITNDEINDIQNIKGDSEIVDNSFVQNNNVNGLNKEKSEISKPVVSFNPKPIIIDTNLINQKEKERDNQSHLHHATRRTHPTKRRWYLYTFRRECARERAKRPFSFVRVYCSRVNASEN